MSFSKRTAVLAAKVLAIMVLGGVGSLVADWYVIPKLASSPSLSRYVFVRRATENTTIINKTEQIVVREDDSVERIASQAASAVVNVISVADDKGAQTAPRGSVNAATGAPHSLNGSGVLATNDGLIVTYRKAILEQNARYTVLLYNGLSYPATLVGIDSLTNLAYLRVQASNLPAIAFANSNDTIPGKKLIALANASEEYRNRFSTALLSNIDKTFNLSEKTVASSEKWEGVFEMDMANQEAYLGGPVINFNGELVGLVGVSDMDNQKHYFLLPANTVKDSLQTAIRGDFDQRPFLGVYYVPITKELTITSNINRDRGALVYAPGKSGLAILSGSPADKAGLLSGDIITAINGQEINLANPLSTTLSRFSKGDQIEILILRAGAEKKLNVQL